MDCPRCRLPLRPADLRGAGVESCESCSGYWLDSDRFDEVARRRELVFDEDERELIETTAGRTRAAPPEKPLPCPKCRSLMKRVSFNADALVAVDRCMAHGVWLDAVELKIAQILAERADAVRDVFLRKLLGA